MWAARRAPELQHTAGTAVAHVPRFRSLEHGRSAAADRGTPHPRCQFQCGNLSQLRAPGKTPSGELHSTETCEMVGDALHSLGVRASRIIRMYYIESLPINHIAANLEVVPSTIRRVLQRSVRTMELFLGDGRKFRMEW